jgi:NAD+ synthase
MATLYYLANELSYLVVGTGNKTEIMVGYSTKYGDGGVDILPIGDLYKTQVFEMAKALNLPDKIINKIPSAGLWKGQSDEEEMGITYKELDKILMAIEKNHGWAINDASFCIEEKISLEDYRKVKKMVDNSEHKRKMPPIYPIWS